LCACEDWKAFTRFSIRPFTTNGTVDVESQARLTEYLVEQVAHGLGLFGNASEGSALLAEERGTILKALETW